MFPESEEQNIFTLTLVWFFFLVGGVVALYCYDDERIVYHQLAEELNGLIGEVKCTHIHNILIEFLVFFLLHFETFTLSENIENL